MVGLGNAALGEDGSWVGDFRSEGAAKHVPTEIAADLDAQAVGGRQAISLRDPASPRAPGGQSDQHIDQE